MSEAKLARSGAGSLAGAAVFVAFVVALGAVTLLIGGRGEQTGLGYQAILILASYPLDVFGGLTKLVMFTVIPAAFITGLPVHLVDHFTWATAATLAGVSVAAIAFARWSFTLGLKRYRSGALWVRA